MQFVPLDLERLLEALSTEPHLRYVLVGGLAVMAHGGTRNTRDADLAIAFDLENRKRVVRALAPLNPRPERLASGAHWIWDELCVRAPWSLFVTDAGRVDLLVRMSGVESFDALYERSEVHEVFGMSLRIASIDDLLAMKRTAGRDRDQEDIRQLEAIQKLTAEGA